MCVQGKTVWDSFAGYSDMAALKDGAIMILENGQHTRPLTHARTHSRTLSRTHALTHALTHSLIFTRTRAASFTRSFTHPLIHSLIHPNQSSSAQGATHFQL
jgi:hypothetical protein